jgi:hypothetical protein
MTVGYSGTSLAKKLGIKEGHTTLVVNAPDDLDAWLVPLPSDARLGSRYLNADVALVFAVTEAEMRRGVDRAMKAIPRDGTIWLCWPKKASGIPSPLQSRDTMMEFMFPLGLVDVKVAAVSETWSGLKFVIRKKLR